LRSSLGTKKSPKNQTEKNSSVKIKQPNCFHKRKAGSAAGSENKSRAAENLKCVAVKNHVWTLMSCQEGRVVLTGRFGGYCVSGWRAGGGGDKHRPQPAAAQPFCHPRDGLQPSL